GWRSAAGASAATSPAAAASTPAANRAAGRAPSRAATMTATMASAGQAGYFIAHATPRASAASTVALSPVLLGPVALSPVSLITGSGRGAGEPGRRARASSASDRQVSAITGGSVIPIASGNAITGQASQNAAWPSAARRRPLSRGPSVTRKAA